MTLNQINNLPGYLPPMHVAKLYEIARGLPNNSTILEIGSYLGKSTVAIAYGCEGSKKKIHCVDTWEGGIDFSKWKNDIIAKSKMDPKVAHGLTDFYGVWSENVKPYKDHITTHKGKSSDVLPTLDLQLNFSFIDGSHQYEDVLNDFNHVYRMTVKGGIIALHDVVQTWPGPFRVWKEVNGKLTRHQTVGSLAFGYKR